jgi:hypothetical protein
MIIIERSQSLISFNHVMQSPSINHLRITVGSSVLLGGILARNSVIHVMIAQTKSHGRPSVEPCKRQKSENIRINHDTENSVLLYLPGPLD